MGEIINFPDHKITLYEFNKTNMAQIKPYDPITLNRMCGKVANEIWDGIFFSEEPKLKTYWMLLCKERSDYTVFCIEHDVNELAAAITECLTNRGHVLDITRQDNGSYEIWIRDFDTDENVVYYFFDYDNAIIEV